MGPKREVLGFIVNIRFKICRLILIRLALDLTCVTSVQRLGSGAESAAGRPLARTVAASIKAKSPGAPGGPVSLEDREWLHCPPIP